MYKSVLSHYDEVLEVYYIIVTKFKDGQYLLKVKELVENLPTARHQYSNTMSFIVIGVLM